MSGITSERELNELAHDVDIRNAEQFAKHVLPMIQDAWKADLKNDRESFLKEMVGGLTGGRRNTQILPTADRAAWNYGASGLSDRYYSYNGVNPINGIPITPRAGEMLRQRRKTPYDGQFETFGEFIQCVQRASRAQMPQIDQRLAAGFAYQEQIRNAMMESTGSEGGFTVPEEFRAVLEFLMIEQSVIESGCMRLPMESQTLRFPSIRDETHANGAVFGGVKAYMVPEGGDIETLGDETEPTFSDLLLTARKLIAYTVASNDLLKDSALAFEALITKMFPMAMQWVRESKIITAGTGAGEPISLLNANCKVAADLEAGQTIATPLTYQNVLEMWSRMLPFAQKNAIWLVNQTLWPYIGTLSVPVGTGGSAVFTTNVTGQTAAQPMPQTLMGRPIMTTEHCMAAGTEGDIILVDPSFYVIGDRQDTEIAASTQVKFTQDKTVWRIIQRWDGRPWTDVPLTPEHGTKTLSPIVTLATRS